MGIPLVLLEMVAFIGKGLWKSTLNPFCYVATKNGLKTFSAFFILDTFLYFRKFNAEFNKLIKTVDHVLVLFRKIILNTPTFANNFDFIWIFPFSHLSSP